MRVALITDDHSADLANVAGSIEAVLRHAPADLELCRYVVTVSSLWAYHRRALRQLGAQLAGDGVAVIHAMTAGLPAIAARRIGIDLGLPLLADYRFRCSESIGSATCRLVEDVAHRTLEKMLYGACLSGDNSGPQTAECSGAGAERNQRRVRNALNLSGRCRTAATARRGVTSRCLHGVYVCSAGDRGKREFSRSSN